ncbi:unnamed protein product [Ixodes pacificus]
MSTLERHSSQFKVGCKFLAHYRHTTCIYRRCSNHKLVYFDTIDTHNQQSPNMQQNKKLGSHKTKIQIPLNALLYSGIKRNGMEDTDSSLLMTFKIINAIDRQECNGEATSTLSKNAL